MQCVTINFSVNNIKTYYVKSPLYGHLCNYKNIYTHSMDGHRSHVAIFLLTKVIIKRRIILYMQFPNQPLGVKWKVVKVVHCPTL